MRELTSAEQVNDLPIHGCAAKLTAMRDLAYIRWRYFSGKDQTVSAFAFRSRPPDQEVLVTVNQRIRGFRNQIKTLNVLDVYPEVPAEEWLRIVGALLARYQKSVDAIVLRNQNQDLQDLFCRRGFQLRTLRCSNWLVSGQSAFPADFRLVSSAIRWRRAHLTRPMNLRRQARAFLMQAATILFTPGVDSSWPPLIIAKTPPFARSSSCDA